jgi:hypothetical protein
LDQVQARFFRLCAGVTCASAGDHQPGRRTAWGTERERVEKRAGTVSRADQFGLIRQQSAPAQP